jgi:hypothetical protein
MDGRPLACAALSERFRGVFDQWEVDILVTSLMFDVFIKPDRAPPANLAQCTLAEAATIS